MPRSEAQDFDPDVAAWRDAFIAANGFQPAVVPKYEKGWFVWRHSSGWVTSRDRRSALIEMTKRLEHRAAKEKPDGE